MPYSLPTNEPPFQAFPRSHLTRSIPAVFEQQVIQQGEKIAIQMEKDEISYQALNALANRIAHQLLIECGEEKHTETARPVILLMHQGIEAIAVILGILKAGMLYVPVEPTDLPQRIALICSESDAQIIVTDSENKALAHTVSAKDELVPILNVDSLSSTLPIENPAIEITPMNYCYIFFTSGSTGQPKGVVDNHRNLLHNILRYTNNLNITADDHLSLVQSCSFSGSVSSIFAALLNGATLHPIDVRREGIAILARRLADEKISIYHSVPTLFEVVTEQLVATEQRLPALRVIRLEGDQCYPRHIALFKQHYDDCIMANGLGTTETGLCSQYLIDKSINISSDVVPIGTPPVDMEILIVNEDGSPLPPGHYGELTVKSAYLAVGYWRNRELTAAKFKPCKDPAVRQYYTGDMGRQREDGTLEYLGRSDFQIKLRGQRVEIEGIQTLLDTLPEVYQAVVSPYVNTHGHQQLLAYLVPQPNQQIPDVTQLRTLLSSKFPAYMHPARFITLAQLPLDNNGKVARKDLLAPNRQRPELGHAYMRTESELEKQIAEVWCNLLQLDCVGIHDNFFDLGGDSLLAFMLPLEIRQVTGLVIPEGVLLQAPTVSQLCKLLEQHRQFQNHAQCIVPIQQGGSKRPLFFVGGHTGRVLEFRDLAPLLGPERPFYALQPEASSQKTYSTEIKKIASTYLNAIREIQATGPYQLAGYCFGGLIALEMAQQLKAQGERVEPLILIETTCPGEETKRKLSLQRHWADLATLSAWKKIARIAKKAVGALNWLILSMKLKLSAHQYNVSNIEKAHGIASANYRLLRYDDEALLIGFEPDSAYQIPHHTGWNQWLTDNMQVVTFARSHGGRYFSGCHFFHEPYLSKLAEELRKYLT